MPRMTPVGIPGAPPDVPSGSGQPRDGRGPRDRRPSSVSAAQGAGVLRLAGAAAVGAAVAQLATGLWPASDPFWREFGLAGAAAWLDGSFGAELSLRAVLAGAGAVFGTSVAVFAGSAGRPRPESPPAETGGPPLPELPVVGRMSPATAGGTAAVAGVSADVRPILASLLFHARTFGCVVHVAAAGRGGASARLCAELATAIAATGRTAVVVDAAGDSRLAALLSAADRSPGLAEVVSGRAIWTDAVRTTGIPRVRLLPATTPAATGRAVFGAGLESLLREIRAVENYVILHGPSLETAADLETIPQAANAILLVVRPEAPAMRRCAGLVSFLLGVWGGVLGVVVDEAGAGPTPGRCSARPAQFRNRE